MSIDIGYSCRNSRSRRVIRTKKGVLAAAVVVSCIVPVAAAQAGGVISFGDDQALSIGFGLRASFSSTEHGAPDGKSRSNDFNLDDARLYLGASLNSWIKGTFNTEIRAGSGTVGEQINVIDGIAQFEPIDEANLWIGRMLPPNDRANLDGPFYLLDWTYPGVASRYPSKTTGRDDGATFWGRAFGKTLTYAIGAFEGHNRVAGASNQSGNLSYTGRIAYDFLDPEPAPAYYTGSSYFGSVDVLTLAFTGTYEGNGVGTNTSKGDFKAWNFDGLFEKNLDEFGVVTLEGAYYQYHGDGVADCSFTTNDTANACSISLGNAYLVGAAYMFAPKIGWGQFQPYFRYQRFDPEPSTESAASISERTYDIGVNYVIAGPNAKIAANYTLDQKAHSADNDTFILGVQVQF
jgi:hypothetical protein